MNFKFNKKTITLFEAFSGIGTQAMALKGLSNDIGFNLEVLGVSEIDKYCIRSYEAIHGKVAKIDPVTNEVLAIYESQTIAAKENNITREGVRDVSNGRYKTAGGYIWKRINE